jgi:hypothetical protein
MPAKQGLAMPEMQAHNQERGNSPTNVYMRAKGGLIE